MNESIKRKIEILSKPIEERTFKEKSEIEPFLIKISSILCHKNKLTNHKECDIENFFSYFECQCMSPEHTLKFYYDTEENSLSCCVFLNQFRNLWKRIKIAVKYIFNYKCVYGHWDFFELKDDDIDKLIYILAMQKKRNNPKEIIHQIDEYIRMILNELPNNKHKICSDLEYSDCSNITDEDYDRILLNILSEKPLSYILSIPGIYDIICDELNIDVLMEYINEIRHNKN